MYKTIYVDNLDLGSIELESYLRQGYEIIRHYWSSDKQKWAIELVRGR